VGEEVRLMGAHLHGERGYSSVGAVVGATYPQQLEELREDLPGVPFLVPGYGAQGAGAKDVVGAFDDRGLGAVVNASRSIIFAYREAGEPERFARVAGEAAKGMKLAINEALEG
jgi:orotidine-5'-phosphate decarboxylase